MFKFLLILLVLLYAKNCAIIEKPQVFRLPKVFDVINRNCADSEEFCKIDVKLTPVDEQNPSEIWKEIDQITKGDKRFYRRDLIYRGICAEKDVLSTNYNEYLKDGLRGIIERSYCIGKVKFYELVDYLDIIFGYWAMWNLQYLVGLPLPINLIFNSSMNKRMVESEIEFTRRFANKYIEIFSISNTWKELTKQVNSEASKKLGFIQGMRTLTMVLVIMCHNYSVMTLTFSRNPEYVEKFSFHPVAKILLGSFGFVVQTFFAISAWLLALKLHSIVKKNGVITVKDILILAVNRYFRLIPAVIFIIFLYRSTAMEVLLPRVYFSHLEAEQLRCRDGWWTNLLFIQNFSIFEGQMCSPPTWFIAVDTQLYVLLSILFYLSCKFKLSMKLLLGITIIPALCIQTHTVMTTDFDGLYRVTPRNLPVELLSTSPVIIFSYINTICNIAPYAIGFVFGEIYSKNELKQMFSTYAYKIFWFFMFLGLPLIALSLSLHEFSREVETLLAVTLRPIFALGISIGLLGMATNTGGIVKKFLEWQPLVFLGNFTYSVYMFHFLIIFGKIIFWSNMVEHSDFFYLMNLFIDVVLSFAFGGLMYIILEHPCGQLQKILLPQIKTVKRVYKKCNISG